MALSEAEHRRDKSQDTPAADAITIDELRVESDALEETRETARREPAALASW